MFFFDIIQLDLIGFFPLITSI